MSGRPRPGYPGDLAAALHVLRIARGLTQEGAADAAGVTKGMLCGYERGKNAPHLSTLTRLLDAFGFRLADLGAVQAFLRELRGEVKP